MSGSIWEPALMVGVLVALCVLAVWHYIEPRLLRFAEMVLTLSFIATVRIYAWWLQRLADRIERKSRGAS